MSLRLAAALQGSLIKIMARETKAAEQAVMLGVTEATDGLKTELRGQVTGAGFSQKLANTWQRKIFPTKHASINAAGFVYSKAPNIIRAYAYGAVIKSSKGRFLAVPTSAAGKSAMRKKVTPALWEMAHGQKLRFIYRRGGISLLVAENMRVRQGKRGGFTPASATALKSGKNLATVIVFLLIPQLTVRKRFDIESAERKWNDALPRLIVQNWQEIAEK